MKCVLIAATVLCFSQSGQTTGFDNLQIDLVQVIFRHGERTPREQEHYRNDPHNMTMYKGLQAAQLTNLGKKREYILGKMLRNRYNDFLGDQYYPQDVYAQSSNTDRTKMSLQLVLAALYPPTKSQIWNPELPWMPIPTHHMPNEFDILFSSNLCPALIRALARVKRIPEIQNKLEAYHTVFEYLSEKTGEKIEQLDQFFDIYLLLMVQQGMNLTRPKWLTDPVMESMKKIMGLYYDMLTYNNEMKRLFAGPLIRTFVENLNESETVKPSRKIYLYSGHETNVAGFTRAHGFKIPSLPDFGSAVILEKLKDSKTGLIYVKLFVWTGVTEELVQLNLNNSSDPVPIEVYQRLVHDFIPSDKEMSCLLNGPRTPGFYFDRGCSN